MNPTSHPDAIDCICGQYHHGPCQPARSVALSQPDLVAAVRAHALKNYEKGWDIVVECYEDADIARIIGRSATVAGAIREVNKGVRLHNDQRRDIEAEIF